MKIKIISFYLFTVVFSVNVFAGDSLNIPQKVYQLFHNAFPEVKNESWYKFPDTYEAYFKNADFFIQNLLFPEWKIAPYS